MNEKEFDFLGITKWHELGYTGKGITLAELEVDVDTSLPFFDGKVVDVYGEKRDHDHGGQVMDLMHQVAPDSTIYALRYSYNSVTKKGNAPERIKFIQDNVDVCGSSKAIYTDGYLKQLYEQCKNNGVIFVGAAGNEYGGNMMSYTKDNVFWGIVAAHLNDDLKLAYYNSEGPEMDFISLSYLEVHKSQPPYGPMKVQGTSFAQPIFSGMLALVQQFFKEKIGRKLTHDEMYEFVKENCIDLADKGHDVESGHGLFILPEPGEIDLSKYGGDNMNNPNKIIIHHSAGTDNKVLKDFDSIRNYHINENGWRDIGYHYVVESVNNEYKVIQGRKETDTGAHTVGQNNNSIGICVIGNFMNESPSNGQIQALVNLIKDIHSRYGKLPIYGHRDFNSTSCPGDKFPLEQIKKLVEGDNMFKDNNEISDWAKKHVDRVVEFGIMNGVGDNKFAPKEPVTREQIAVIASNIVKYIMGK